MWEVEYTDEFGHWWEALTPDEQDAVRDGVELLRRTGPMLGRPYVDTAKASRFPNMKELRTQCHGQPYRTFFVFDPRRCAVLLIGGCKTGDDRFYEKLIPQADKLYEQHLHELREEGLL